MYTQNKTIKTLQRQYTNKTHTRFWYLNKQACRNKEKQKMNKNINIPTLALIHKGRVTHIYASVD